MVNSLSGPVTARENLVGTPPAQKATLAKTSGVEICTKIWERKVIEGVMTKGVRMTETVIPDSG